MLAELSRGRARQGFTATETAVSVFALKDALFEVAMRAEQPLAALIAASRWVDELGLFTFESYARAREEVIAEQAEQLLELSTPVVKLWEGVVAVPLVGTLDSARAQVVMERLLQTLVDTGSPYAIIDITGVPAVDTQVAQHLLKTVVAARLMGAECIISGIRPQIAQTIVALGIEFGDIATKATPGRRAAARAARQRRRGRATPRRGGAPDGTGAGPQDRRHPAGLDPGRHAGPDGAAAAGGPGRADRRHRRHGVIIDITALDIVDSFVGRMLSTIASISRVLDAETVVVGMRPAVAITLVELGLSLDGVRTALNVERGMELLARRSRAERRRRADDDDPATPERRCAVTDERRPRATGDAAPIAADEDVVRVRQLVRTARRRGQAVPGRPDQAGHRGQRAGPQHPGLRRRRAGARSRPVDNGRRRGVRIVFADDGPGIADLDLALTDGYTTGGGLGLGLAAPAGWSTSSTSTPRSAQGTTVTVTKWAR